ncbi:coiled-coil domain-containing protein 142 [Eudromia elegans]
MEAGGLEAGCGTPPLEAAEAAGPGLGAGLDTALLLLMARVPPGRVLPPPRGPRGGLARSLQRAEAVLRSCVSPGLRRRLPPVPPAGECSADSEDEEAPGALAQLERSFAGLRRGLCVLEEPHTETFRGHVRPPAAHAAFSHHALRPRVAQRCATLHALLQHRHALRLCRHYCRRLRAASAFVRRLLRAPREPPPAALRPLCQELRAHAGHWRTLQQRVHADPWLHPLLLQRHDALLHMCRALRLLALQALWLLEGRAEAALRALARGPAPPAQLRDLLEGLGIYNRVAAELAQEPGPSGAPAPRPFPAARVLAVLAAERGRITAQQLQRLLRPSVGAAEELGRAEELRALCCEEQQLVELALGALAASAGSLWPSTGGCASPLDGGPAAAPALRAQYALLYREAAGTALRHAAEAPAPCGAVAATGPMWDVDRALAQARLPPACEEELQRLCLHVLCCSVCAAWDQGFTRALGSGLSDKCSAEAEAPRDGDGAGAGAAAQSRTARRLQQLYPVLASALRRLPPQCAAEDGPPAPPGPRMQLLGRCVATAQAAGAWLMGRAYQYLAAWALRPFLLVTQGDLQLLKAEMEELAALVDAACPALGDGAARGPHELLSHQEQQLCQEVRAAAAGIQRFSADVLRLFCSDCKRMAAEIFEQTMPLGKHWRLGLRPELPSSPSAYAAAAAQTVLGQVLQGAQLLPRDTQAPTLARVTTAFAEAWMDHILARKIKFSLQGALQLQQDFALLRELLQSERYALAPESRRALLSLRVFQQMDGAILCLLQQPAGSAALPAHTWHALRRCCSAAGARAQDLGAGSLDSLRSAEGGAGGPRAGPQPYVCGSQQQWLALRLHGPRRWRVPGLPCMARAPEP